MSRSKLDRLCEKLRIRIDARYGAVKLPEDWPRGSHPYLVTLRKGRRQLTTPFYMGSAHAEPTAADVLSCLVLDASIGEQPFEDFCADMGADPDSRKAEATWRACKRIGPRLRRFLGEDYNAVASAEH